MKEYLAGGIAQGLTYHAILMDPANLTVSGTIGVMASVQSDRPAICGFSPYQWDRVNGQTIRTRTGTVPMSLIGSGDVWSVQFGKFADKLADPYNAKFVCKRCKKIYESH